MKKLYKQSVLGNHLRSEISHVLFLWSTAIGISNSQAIQREFSIGKDDIFGQTDRYGRERR
jgi:hypothetical protein